MHSFLLESRKTRKWFVSPYNVEMDEMWLKTFD